MTETSDIVRVAQIVDGDPVCYCGAPAVLIVTTEPDGDPGPTCYEHGMECINLMIGLTGRMFGPKEPEGASE